MDIIKIGLMFDNTDPTNPVQLDGWHINALQPILGAEEHLIVPRNPKFGILGVPNDLVYHYKFESQSQADSYLPVEVSYNGNDIN